MLSWTCLRVALQNKYPISKHGNAEPPWRIRSQLQLRARFSCYTIEHHLDRFHQAAATAALFKESVVKHAHTSSIIQFKKMKL